MEIIKAEALDGVCQNGKYPLRYWGNIVLDVSSKTANFFAFDGLMFICLSLGDYECLEEMVGWKMTPSISPVEAMLGEASSFAQAQAPTPIRIEHPKNCVINIGGEQE